VSEREGPKLDDSSTPTLRRLRALFLFLIVLGFADAARRAWLCDDAFISFRYAEHLAAGRGLVFNPGEYVQGFTNPLLTLMLAALVKLGLPMEGSAIGVGLAAFAGTLALLVRHAKRASSLPLAALGLVAMVHARDFATSGLETSLFVLLVLASVLLAEETREPKRAFAVGVLASLAALTRLDGLLVYGLVGLMALVRGVRERRMRPVFAMALPALLLLLPWLVFAQLYYGDILPNTFYAKSASHPWPLQGLHYVGLFLLAYAPLTLGLLALLRARRRPHLRLWLVVTLSWFAYVSWVGGDFMFARFCLPVAPLLLLGLEDRLSQLEPLRLAALAGLMMAGLLLIAPTDWAAEQDSSIGDERGFYQSPVCDLETSEVTGRVVRPILEGTNARVVIVGSQARLAYYARLPYALEASTGLTDREIAHRSLAHRGRVGHEKGVTRSYLEQRDMNLIFDYCQESLPHTDYDGADFGQGVTGYVYAYDAPLMDTLRARGVRIPSFEDYLDAYLARIDRVPDAQVARDYEEFRLYYFTHTHDEAREALFRARLSSSAL